MGFIQKTIKVSICLTTYNGSKYLQQQLDSFSAQSVLPDELVVCDDGSTDATCEIIERFKETAPFDVRLYKNENNLGYAQNFSKALGLCKGIYVFLSDQDDVWLPKKIESVLKVFESDPSVLVVIHDLEFCDADLVPIGQKKIERMLLVSNSLKSYVTGMATAIKGDFLRLCLPVPAGAFTHDAWLHSCGDLIKARRVIPEVLALYRRHDANASSYLLINQVRKINYLNSFRYKLLGISNKEIVDRLDRLIELDNWATTSLYTNNFYAVPEEINKIIAEINEELISCRRRLEIIEANFFAKFILAIKLYRAGGYRYFSGYKTLIKDILIN